MINYRLKNFSLKKQVMFGGKPVTVQMAGGGSKTLTLMPQQQGITQVGKIVRIPSTSSVTSSPEQQPKLMVVQRPKQPTATIGKLIY